MTRSFSQGRILLRLLLTGKKKIKKGSNKKESGTLILKYVTSSQRDSLLFYRLHGLKSFHAVSLASRISNAVTH